MEYFNYKNYSIELNRKSKNKNIYFRVKTDGIILVTCPYHIEKDMIERYLDKFIAKVENKYETSQLNKLDYRNGGNFMFLASNYEITYLKATKNHCQFDGDKLLVYMKEPSYESAIKVIDKFLKEKATKILNERFLMIIQEFQHLDFVPILKIRKMTSKFGICYYKKATITLSTLLLHYDYECIDYVIIHELAHFIQPNHSKKFYYLVEKYLPNYKEVEAKLKNLKIAY